MLNVHSFTLAAFYKYHAIVLNQSFMHEKNIFKTAAVL